MDVHARFSGNTREHGFVMNLNLGSSRKATDCCNFELQTATNLYWATVPAVVYQPGRDQQKADLTVRILSGVDRHNPSSQVGGQLAVASQFKEFLWSFPPSGLTDRLEWTDFG